VGGLVTVLQDVFDQIGLWFGWSGKVTAEPAFEIVQHGKANYATTDLTTDQYQNFYVGFANGALWPLFHFRLGLIEFRREHMEGYRSVNRSMAAKLSPLLSDSDVVWVHDYQLIPMAAALRELGHKNRIGFFMHIPFVPASVFSALPRGDTLLRDFCAYDVVGFQTAEHWTDFCATVKQILGYAVDKNGVIDARGRNVLAMVAPVGIDTHAFERLAIRAAKGRNNKRLRDSLVGRHLVIGADRLDYSKGLSNRFEAFNRLLTRFPEHKQKVSYLQIAAPSREDVTEYAALRPELSRMAGDINGRHATFDWVPLRYMSQGVSRATLAGFYRAARVGLVTPLRDGMNLVAHEYLAAQDPDDPGVLILSRFAGAAAHLTEALIVNPYDPDEIAEALHMALTMSDADRRFRHNRLLRQLKKLNASSHAQTFLAALSASPLESPSKETAKRATKLVGGPRQCESGHVLDPIFK
jgi:trehalose 6-phosphate synthase